MLSAIYLISCYVCDVLYYLFDVPSHAYEVLGQTGDILWHTIGVICVVCHRLACA